MCCEADGQAGADVGTSCRWALTLPPAASDTQPSSIRANSLEVMEEKEEDTQSTFSKQIAGNLTGFVRVLWRVSGKFNFKNLLLASNDY